MNLAIYKILHLQKHKSTNLYRKDRYKPRMFLPSSCHPGHISKNITYSMAFRLLGICSNVEMII